MTAPSARPGLDRAEQATVDLKLALDRMRRAAYVARDYVDGDPLPDDVVFVLHEAIDATIEALLAYQSEDEAKKAEHAKAQAHYRAQVTGLILEEQREARHAATHDRDGEGRS